MPTEHHQDFQLGQAQNSKANTIRKKIDKNLTEKIEIPATEEKRNAEPTDPILLQNAGVINRLEMIVRGLEAQLRLKDHTIDDLRQKLSKINSAPKGEDICALSCQKVAFI